MRTIQTLKLGNFKKFEQLRLEFGDAANVLVGDNEAGKSSILVAIDLCLAASRARVESAGLDMLINQSAVKRFLSGDRAPRLLPEAFVEIFLSPGRDPDLNGKCNSEQRECDGLRMSIRPSDHLAKEIADLLKSGATSFPYDYYTVDFTTFAGEPYSRFRDYVRHILLDSSRIDTEYATRDYIRAVFELNTNAAARSALQHGYRESRAQFKEMSLFALNQKLSDYEFGLKTSVGSDLDSNLAITEDDIPIDGKGRGRQCFIKTEFALRRGTNGGRNLDVLLLEEPENHLSQPTMKKLIDRISKSIDRQIIIATHSNRIAARLDLRNVQLLSRAGKAMTLKELPDETAKFFIKSSDFSLLQFCLARKVILVEGDAEFILIDELYKLAAGESTSGDEVVVIPVGGTAFKRYLDVARILGTQTAVVRDNDGDFQENCVENYAEYIGPAIKVFADPDAARSTFEICLYQDNVALCEELFKAGRRSLSTLEFMLANKTEAAFKLLESGRAIQVPQYINDAILWLRK